MTGFSNSLSVRDKGQKTVQCNNELPVQGMRGITSLYAMTGKVAKVRTHVKWLFASSPLKGLHFSYRNTKNLQWLSELIFHMCQALNKYKFLRGDRISKNYIQKLYFGSLYVNCLTQDQEGLKYLIIYTNKCQKKLIYITKSITMC